MRYKVGDEVIPVNAIIGQYPSATAEMLQLVKDGTPMRVVSVMKHERDPTDTNSYYVCDDPDGFDWVWREEWLMPAKKAVLKKYFQ